MSKEIYISSTPHETRLAIVEGDELAEIYYERENEYTLAGSIYNGKVTRVLPGMQSSFVDIGLERDAFLYITDFMEEAGDSADFDSGDGGARSRARGEGSRPDERRRDGGRVAGAPETSPAPNEEETVRPPEREGAIRAEWGSPGPASARRPRRPFGKPQRQLRQSRATAQCHRPGRPARSAARHLRARAGKSGSDRGHRAADGHWFPG